MRWKALRSAQGIIGDLISDFAEGKLDEVYCLYNEFKSAIS
jgi:F0F1-type ATP synthase gamma subunit